MKRNRVVINKPSLELLIELNEYANGLGAEVVIGLDKVTKQPAYIIHYGEYEKGYVKKYAKTKEEVLEKLISHVASINN